jgi:hypothetical protein
MRSLLAEASVLWMPHPFSVCRIRSPKQCSLLPSVIAMHFAKHTE